MRVSILNLLLGITIIGLCIALFVKRNREPILVGDHFSHAFYRLSNEFLDHRTSWNLESTPPLGSSQIAEICKTITDDLEAAHPGLDWRLGATNLVSLDEKLDYWCYHVTFTGRHRDCEYSGPSIRFSALILFDESVVVARGETHGGRDWSSGLPQNKYIFVE